MADNRKPVCLHCAVLNLLDFFFIAHPLAEQDDGCDLTNRDAYALMSLARVIGQLVAKLPDEDDRITLFDCVIKRAAEHANITVSSSRDDEPPSKELH